MTCYHNYCRSLSLSRSLLEMDQVFFISSQSNQHSSIYVCVISCPESELSIKPDCLCDISDCQDTCAICDTLPSSKCHSVFSLLLIQSHGKHFFNPPYFIYYYKTSLLLYTSYSNGGLIPITGSVWSLNISIFQTSISSLMVQSSCHGQLGRCLPQPASSGSCPRSH